MTIEHWLQQAILQLTDARIETARLDALVLLCDELACDKSYVLAHPEQILQRSTQKKLNKKIIQRIDYVPLAYLRGKAEFYGREFIVDDRVLVPRPESEAIIELFFEHLPNHSGPIIDIGTGSGALAITAALELPKAHVFATDIDRLALTVAHKNAEQLHAGIDFFQGNLLEPLQEISFQNSVILANLPYVPTTYPINTAATHEPQLALFSGDDGLDVYRKLCAQIAVLNQKPSAIITEALCMQHKNMTQLLHAINYELIDTKDLVQYFVYKEY